MKTSPFGDSESLTSAQHGGESGEMRCLRAVLCRAIQDYLNMYDRKKDPYAQKRGQEAKNWLFSTNGNGQIHSFSGICRVIGLPEKRLRELLRAINSPESCKKVREVLKKIQIEEHYRLSNLLDQKRRAAKRSVKRW